MDKCEVKKCRNTAYITFYDHSVCEKHWTQHCENRNKHSLFRKLQIQKQKT